jgi:DEAD/DEAH box helicase domain-containing protein
MVDISALIDDLNRNDDFTRQVAHFEKVPPREGSYADFPPGIRPCLADALKKTGITQLYSHQRAAYDAVTAGKNTVIVTPTASGKTLCYNLPVLQTLLEERETRALYLFPTKALSQDQQSELNALINASSLPLPVHTYDGDTPSSVRIAARKTGRIVISNPDMLHAGILPNHPRWIKFISALRFVVIDEIHTYRGVFGSHMANLLRRLLRVTRFYGADPLFICCSATIGNPKELTEQLLGTPVTLIDNNGAPSGEKNIILYNPPLVDRVQGIRRGVVLEAQRIGAEILTRGAKTIIFARSRVRVELIASYIRGRLANFFTDNSRIRVESYRGGYLPRERRAIEKGLREGSVHGVVSTNALELGIDIGGLDVSILAGIPGSVASAWQQTGRAGRRTAPSLSVLIASASPTDQYMIKHPEYFLSKSPESGWIDPDNIYILLDHLKCAVFELPVKENERFGVDARELLGYLEENGVVRYSEGTYYWADRGYPAENVSLRSATAENVVIVDSTGERNTVIGEMDLPSAKQLLFKNAVYIHRGDQYFVQELDLEDKRCYVTQSTVNFYTDAIVKTDIKVLGEDEKRPFQDFSCVLGDILVRRQVAKFKKLKYKTHENIGYGEIHLPEDEMHTRTVVLLFGPASRAGAYLRSLSEEFREIVLSKVGTLLINVAPFILLCDRRDISVAERVRDPHFTESALYIYEMYPGGIGLAEGFLRNIRLILEAAAELVGQCPCSRGCPSCIGPEGTGSEIDPKEGVVRFLHECS